jgi:hypothetical protein
MNADEVPTLSRNRRGQHYPARGTRLGDAWAESYLRFVAAGEDWTDGYTVANEVAGKHGLMPSTLIALYTRMATGGHLKREHREVKTNRGMRMRTHYRA